MSSPRNIVILTGAGISAESGLGTFRDTGGLWSRHSLEEVATPQGFAADPARVLSFYNARRANARAARPNAAHAALAGLQRDPRFRIHLVTQNIDDLHQRAGSDAIHMHGEILRALCPGCDHRWDAPAEMRPDDACTRCGAMPTRPDVVWFGEFPYHMARVEGALAALTGDDLFVAIGTSGQVYPAAGFVQLAREAGAETLEINLEPTDSAGLFDARLTGPATEAVPAWVARLSG